jgi:phage/plasmid-associated DNA primase
MKDLHNECTRDNCLCEDNNHGVKKETIVDLVNDDTNIFPSNEPRDYERAVEDADELWQLRCNGVGRGDPLFALTKFVKLLVFTEHKVSKFDVNTELNLFCRKNGIENDDPVIIAAVDIVWGNVENFQCIKNISYALGVKGAKIKFEKSQLEESGEWIKGNNFIKRIEITGDLLFFNGKYYERNAEALIRRFARQIIEKCKTSDVTEVVRYIEDTCKIITWRDIEHSIHMKCMKNGLYDIKNGIFSTKFSPDYIILGQIPHNYNEDSSFKEIDEIVTTLLPRAIDKQSFYDFISSCMHPYTGIDYQFGTVGVSGTGKSQLGTLAKMTLGEDNCNDAKIHDLAKDQTMQKSAAFYMLNYDDDLNDQSIKQIDVIKKWVTQSSFTARGIYEQPVTFRPMSRLMFSANDLYEVPNHDDAEAIYDRTYLVRIDKKFRHQSAEIKNVMQKIANEPQLDGFITYLLKNATWMAEHEKYHHPISVKLVESIWNTFGNRISEFKKKWIVMDATYRLDANDPYNKWSEYCIKNNFKSKTKKEFKDIFDELVGNIPTKTRKSQPGDSETVEIYAYTGFRLKNEYEIEKEEQNPITRDTDNGIKALCYFSSFLISEKDYGRKQ